MGRVSVAKTKAGIDGALQKALDLLGGLQTHIRPQDVVMVKPNVNGTEGITDIRLVEAVLQRVLDSGIRKVFLAESSFGSAEMTDAFLHQTGYDALAKRYDVSLINLNRSRAVEVEVKNPFVLTSVAIAEEAMETDRIINIPVMKVHYATGISLAMKNLKGLLALEEKRRFHEVGLDRAIVDLNSVIRPDLNIIDGIRCMERMGPRGGDLIDLNLLLAGTDCGETDAVGCRIMEHSIEEVKHLQLYLEANDIDPAEIDVSGERIEDVAYPFKKAQMSGAVPGGFVIHDIDACSSCMNALLLSFEILGKEASRETHIFLGKKIDDDPAWQGAYRIAFGNCCDRNVPFDKMVKGCPPYPFALEKALSG